MQNEPQLFTVESRWELVSKAATELHAVMRKSRRYRWWFLRGTGSQSNDQGTEGDHEELVFKQWKFFRGEGGGLYCEIRADCYEPTGSPQISIEFRNVPRRVGVRPPDEMRDKRVVVRIGLTEEGRQGATIGKVSEDYAAFGAVAKEYPVYDGITKGRTVPSSPEQARSHIRQAKSRTLSKKLAAHPGLKQYEPAINPSVQQWWIDPKRTPVHLTKFVLLAYLVREDYIDPNTPEIKSFLRCLVFSRWMKDPNIQQLDELNILYEISMRFAIPQRWNDVVTYIKKTVFGMASNEVTGPRLGRLTVENLASKAGVHRRTIYKWVQEDKIPVKREKVGDLIFSKASLEKAIELAEEKEMSKNLTKYLIGDCGKTPDAAYKWIQRKKKKGLSLEDIAREVLRERDRQS